MNLVEKLREALCFARSAANTCNDVEDGGTCNFDHPILMKSEDLTDNEIELAFNLADIKFDKETSGMWKDCYHILGVCEGQGSRRTEMAEQFADALIECGFTATVYYQMD